jgi:hypothetical protein
MCNSRIYSQSSFDKQFESMVMGMLCCPECYENNISHTDGQFVLFHDYICLSCRLISNKSNFLYKNSQEVIKGIRDKKIEEILKK